ncbi:MAG: hypothetical protein HYW24_02565 [Candidatus Aenigmarchaeota archaeon]|nr:hypothetical protein [Candidatus Aenigmarchaeota archaeon]
MNDKQIVVSSYSDLSRISPNIRKVHFRKFISKNLLKNLLLHCPELKRISVSNSASKRLNDKLVSYIAEKGIEIEYSKSASGRPNLLHKLVVL